MENLLDNIAEALVEYGYDEEYANKLRDNLHHLLNAVSYVLMQVRATARVDTHLVDELSKALNDFQKMG